MFQTSIILRTLRPATASQPAALIGKYMNLGLGIKSSNVLPLFSPIRPALAFIGSSVVVVTPEGKVSTEGSARQNDNETVIKQEVSLNVLDLVTRDKEAFILQAQDNQQVFVSSLEWSRKRGFEILYTLVEGGEGL